jgi:hypothetical protein
MRPPAPRFADLWLDQHVADAPAGPIYASDLADQLIKEGIAAGIPAEDFSDEGGGLFEMVFAALEKHRR